MIDEDSSELIEQLTETLYNLQFVQRTAAREARQIESLIQKLSAAEDNDSVCTTSTSTTPSTKIASVPRTQRRSSSSRRSYTHPIRRYKQEPPDATYGRNHTVSPDRTSGEGQQVYLSQFPTCTLKIGDRVAIVNPGGGDKRGVVVGSDGSRFVLVKTPSKLDPTKRYPKNLKLLHYA